LELLKKTVGHRRLLSLERPAQRAEILSGAQGIGGALSTAGGLGVPEARQPKAALAEGMERSGTPKPEFFAVKKRRFTAR
jgi:hypothetical protein